MADFTGEIVHAADFGHVDDYRDRDVLVIGGGNSGVDILNHLVRIPTRSLAVSVRTGTAVLPARLGGFPVQRLSGLIELLPAPAADRLLAATERLAFGDLGRLGLRRPTQGAATRLACSGVAPAVDDGFVAALRDNRVAALPAVARFHDAGVILADGRELFPDVVICATGYRPGLEAMVGHLDILDGNGIPCCRDCGSGKAGCPGLWFMGMWPRPAGTFHAARRESRVVAGAIRRMPGARSVNSRLSIRAGQPLRYRE